MTTNDTEGLRKFLADLIVYGDEKGWVEYTDAGVWITDKGVSAAQDIFTQRLREAERAARIDELNRYINTETTFGVHQSEDMYNGIALNYNVYRQKRLEQLSTTKNEEV